MCHMCNVICDMSCVTCHMSLTPTAIAMDPHPAKGRSPKKCSFNLGFFHKKGGGTEAIQKFLGTFFAPIILEFCVGKVGEQIQKFWGTFSLIFGELGPKKVQKSFFLNWIFGKVPRKFHNSWGGGPDLFWKKPKLKLHFFLRTSLTPPICTAGWLAKTHKSTFSAWQF